MDIKLEEFSKLYITKHSSFSYKLRDCHSYSMLNLYGLYYGKSCL